MRNFSSYVAFRLCFVLCAVVPLLYGCAHAQTTDNDPYAPVVSLTFDAPTSLLLDSAPLSARKPSAMNGQFRSSLGLSLAKSVVGAPRIWPSSALRWDTPLPHETDLAFHFPSASSTVDESRLANTFAVELWVRAPSGPLPVDTRNTSHTTWLEDGVRDTMWCPFVANEAATTTSEHRCGLCFTFERRWRRFDRVYLMYQGTNISFSISHLFPSSSSRWHHVVMWKSFTTFGVVVDGVASRTFDVSSYRAVLGSNIVCEIGTSSGFTLMRLQKPYANLGFPTTLIRQLAAGWSFDDLHFYVDTIPSVATFSQKYNAQLRPKSSLVARINNNIVGGVTVYRTGRNISFSLIDTTMATQIPFGPAPGLAFYLSASGQCETNSTLSRQDLVARTSYDNGGDGDSSSRTAFVMAPVLVPFLLTAKTLAVMSSGVGIVPVVLCMTDNARSSWFRVNTSAALMVYRDVRVTHATMTQPSPRMTLVTNTTIGLVFHGVGFDTTTSTVPDASRLYWRDSVVVVPLLHSDMGYEHSTNTSMTSDAARRACAALDVTPAHAPQNSVIVFQTVSSASGFAANDTQMEVAFQATVGGRYALCFRFAEHGLEQRPYHAVFPFYLTVYEGNVQSDLITVPLAQPPSRGGHLNLTAQLMRMLPRNILPESVQIVGTGACGVGWLNENNQTNMKLLNLNSSSFGLHITNVILSHFDGTSYRGVPCNVSYELDRRISVDTAAVATVTAPALRVPAALQSALPFVVRVVLSQGLCAADGSFPVLVADFSTSSSSFSVRLNISHATATALTLCVQRGIVGGVNSTWMAAAPAQTTTYPLLVAGTTHYTVGYTPMFVNRTYTIDIFGVALPIGSGTVFLSRTTQCTASPDTLLGAPQQPTAPTATSGMTTTTMLRATFNITTTEPTVFVCYAFAAVYKTSFNASVNASAALRCLAPPTHILLSPHLVASAVFGRYLPDISVTTMFSHTPAVVQGTSFPVTFSMRSYEVSYASAAPVFIQSKDVHLNQGESTKIVNDTLLVQGTGFGDFVLVVTATRPDGVQLNSTVNVTIVSPCDEATTCSGHGRCSPRGTCVCHQNYSAGMWTGPRCDRCSKDYYGSTCGTYCTPALSCGGHGACNSLGQCACTSRYAGLSCGACVPGFEYPYCVNCTSPERYTPMGSTQRCSADCNVQETCSGHGRCSPDKTKTCVCSAGYAAFDCRVAVTCAAWPLQPSEVALSSLNDELVVMYRSDVTPSLFATRSVLPTAYGITVPCSHIFARSTLDAVKAATVGMPLVCTVSSPLRVVVSGVTNASSLSRVDLRSDACLDTYESFTVTPSQSSSAVIVQARLNAPSTISSCAGVVLDASTSTSSRGALTYQFRCKTHSLGSGHVAAISSFLSNVSAPITRIPASLLPAGATATIAVRVTNPVGQASEATVSVKKFALRDVENGAVEAMFDNPRRAVNPHEPAIFAVRVFASECALTELTPITFSWEMSTATGQKVVLPSTETTNAFLSLPSYFFAPWKAPYVLQARVYERANPIKATTVTNEIRVASNLYTLAVIVTVPSVDVSTTTVRLSVSSADGNAHYASPRPDVLSETFMWSCTTTSVGVSCPSELALSPSQTVDVVLSDASVAALGEALLVFHVEGTLATRGVLAEQRTATARTVVNVTALRQRTSSETIVMYAPRDSPDSSGLVVAPPARFQGSLILPVTAESVTLHRQSGRACTRWYVVNGAAVADGSGVSYSIVPRDVCRRNGTEDVQHDAWSERYVACEDAVSTLYQSVVCTDDVTLTLDDVSVPNVDAITAVVPDVLELRPMVAFASSYQLPLQYRVDEVAEDGTVWPRTEWRDDARVVLGFSQKEDDGLDSHIRTLVLHARDPYGTVTQAAVSCIVRRNTTLTLTNVLSIITDATALGSGRVSDALGVAYTSQRTDLNARAAITKLWVELSDAALLTDARSSYAFREFSMVAWNESLVMDTTLTELTINSLTSVLVQSVDSSVSVYRANSVATLQAAFEVAVRGFAFVSQQIASAASTTAARRLTVQQQALGFEETAISTARAYLTTGHGTNVFWTADTMTLQCGDLAKGYLPGFEAGYVCVAHVPATLFGLSAATGHTSVVHITVPTSVQLPTSYTVEIPMTVAASNLNNDTCFLWSDQVWTPTLCTRIEHNTKTNTVKCTCSRVGYFIVQPDTRPYINTTTPAPPTDTMAPAVPAADNVYSAIIVGVLGVLGMAHLGTTALDDISTSRLPTLVPNTFHALNNAFRGEVPILLVHKAMARAFAWKQDGGARYHTWLPSIRSWRFLKENPFLPRSLLVAFLHMNVWVHVAVIALVFDWAKPSRFDAAPAVPDIAISTIATSVVLSLFGLGFRSSIARMSDPTREERMKGQSNNNADVGGEDGEGGGESCRLVIAEGGENKKEEEQEEDDAGGSKDRTIIPAQHVDSGDFSDPDDGEEDTTAADSAPEPPGRASSLSSPKEQTEEDGRKRASSVRFHPEPPQVFHIPDNDSDKGKAVPGPSSPSSKQQSDAFTAQALRYVVFEEVRCHRLLTAIACEIRRSLVEEEKKASQVNAALARVREHHNRLFSDGQTFEELLQHEQDVNPFWQLGVSILNGNTKEVRHAGVFFDLAVLSSNPDVYCALYGTADLPRNVEDAVSAVLRLCRSHGSGYWWVLHLNPAPDRSIPELWNLNSRQMTPEEVIAIGMLVPNGAKLMTEEQDGLAGGGGHDYLGLGALLEEDRYLDACAACRDDNSEFSRDFPVPELDDPRNNDRKQWGRGILLCRYIVIMSVKNPEKREAASLALIQQTVERAADLKVLEPSPLSVRDVDLDRNHHNDFLVYMINYLATKTFGCVCVRSDGAFGDDNNTEGLRHVPLQDIVQFGASKQFTSQGTGSRIAPFRGLSSAMPYIRQGDEVVLLPGVYKPLALDALHSLPHTTLIRVHGVVVEGADGSAQHNDIGLCITNCTGVIVSDAATNGNNDIDDDDYLVMRRIGCGTVISNTSYVELNLVLLDPKRRYDTDVAHKMDVRISRIQMGRRRTTVAHLEALPRMSRRERFFAALHRVVLPRWVFAFLSAVCITVSILLCGAAAYLVHTHNLDETTGYISVLVISLLCDVLGLRWIWDFVWNQLAQLIDPFHGFV
eukprot:PhM_4_TR3511/c1_g1_i1/m.60887